MNDEASAPISAPPASGGARLGEIVLGMLPFALLCVGVVIQETPAYRIRATEAAMFVAIYAFLGGYVLILAVLFLAWMKGFPRWSMPYVGYGLVFTLYLFFVATPGLVILNIPMWGREMWGLRACAPLGLVVLLGLLFSRPPWKPLADLCRNIWNDWTFLAFGLYGFLPLLLLILQDEMDHAYSFWPTAIAALFLLAGAALYLIFARKPFRAAFLLGGMFLSVLAVSIGTNFYWRTHSVNMQTFEVTPLNIPAPWPEIMIGALTSASIWTVILAMTGLVGILHNWVGKGRAANV